MTVVFDQAADFTLEALERVALKGEGLRFSKAAMARIADWHRDFHDFLARDPNRFIYGVTSGYGPEAKKLLGPAERAERAARQIPYIGLSFGEGCWPKSHVRAMYFSLAAMAIHGGAALSPKQARAIAAAFKRPLPDIPMSGMTSPGEMMPLFYLSQAIPELFDGTVQASACNGAVGSVAISGLRALAARRRLVLAEQVFALSAEAIRCPLEHFDPALKALWGDPYEAQALDALNHWLAGTDRDDRRPFQAPVSYRILPRVLGQGRRAVAALETAVETALRGMITNPVFVPKDRPGGEVTLSSGAFHEALPSQALDNVMASWVDLAAIAHRQATKLHRGTVSHLPDKLRAAPGSSSTAYMEYVPGDMVEEMRRLAQPTLLSPGDPGSSDQDDVNAPGFIACRMEEKVAELFDRVLTILAVTASQALHLTDRSAPKALRPLLKDLRRHFPPVEARRELGVDAWALSRVLTAHAETGERLT